MELPQLKYFKDNFQELDRMIFASLSQQKIKGQEESDIWGDVMKYPLGTVAKVDFDKKHFYFVAINDVNQYGKPVNQAYNNVETAFDGLFKAINSIGHYDDLAMPLIGTGKAAIREATIENVVEDTAKGVAGTIKGATSKMEQKANSATDKMKNGANDVKNSAENTANTAEYTAQRTATDVTNGQNGFMSSETWSWIIIAFIAIAIIALFWYYASKTNNNKNNKNQY